MPRKGDTPPPGLVEPLHQRGLRRLTINLFKRDCLPPLNLSFFLSWDHYPSSQQIAGVLTPTSHHVLPHPYSTLPTTDNVSSYIGLVSSRYQPQATWVRLPSSLVCSSQHWSSATRPSPSTRLLEGPSTAESVIPLH